MLCRWTCVVLVSSTRSCGSCGGDVVYDMQQGCGPWAMINVQTLLMQYPSCSLYRYCVRVCGGNGVLGILMPESGVSCVNCLECRMMRQNWVGQRRPWELESLSIGTWLFCSIGRLSFQ